MRILTHGSAFWTKNAYGHQLRMLIYALKRAGHTVGQACTFGFQGRNVILDEIALYPQLNDPMGQDVIKLHAQHFGADLVWSLGDVFMLQPELWSKLPCPWLAWTTVDSEPLWEGIRRALGVAATPVAYSRYGQAVLQRAGINAGYAPLAFEPEVFYADDKAAARERLGMPGDKFIVTMVQANRQRDNRKNFFNQIVAFAEFHKKHPEAFLYIHTCADAYRGGFDLLPLIEEMGLLPERDYAFCNQYIETTIGATDDQMRDTYNASDVLLQATKAEGFGVPALEASACRLPVIFTNYAALPEAVHYGYALEYELEWQPAGSWYALPGVSAIVDGLERAYRGEPYDLNKGEPIEYRRDVAEDVWLGLLAPELAEAAA